MWVALVFLTAFHANAAGCLPAMLKNQSAAPENVFPTKVLSPKALVFRKLPTSKKLAALAKRGLEYKAFLAAGGGNAYKSMILEDGFVLEGITLAERVSLMKIGFDMRDAGNPEGMAIVEAVNHASKGRTIDTSQQREIRMVAIREHIVGSYFYHYDKAVEHEKYRIQSGTKELRPIELSALREETVKNFPELLKFLKRRYSESTIQRVYDSKKPEPMDRVIQDWFMEYHEN